MAIFINKFRNTIGRMWLDMVFLLLIQLCLSPMWYFRHMEDCKESALTRSFIFTHLWYFTLCVWHCRNAIKLFRFGLGRKAYGYLTVTRKVYDHCAESIRSFCGTYTIFRLKVHDLPKYTILRFLIHHFAENIRSFTWKYTMKNTHSLVILKRMTT